MLEWGFGGGFAPMYSMIHSGDAPPRRAWCNQRIWRLRSASSSSAIDREPSRFDGNELFPLLVEQQLATGLRVGVTIVIRRRSATTSTWRGQKDLIKRSQRVNSLGDFSLQAFPSTLLLTVAGSSARYACEGTSIYKLVCLLRPTVPLWQSAAFRRRTVYY